MIRKIIRMLGYEIIPKDFCIDLLKEATEFEKLALDNESEGHLYAAGYAGGKAAALSQIEARIYYYNAAIDRADEGGSVK